MKKVWIVLTVALWACGDDDGSDSGEPKTLENFAGCGGDVVGSWTFVGLELDIPSAFDDCDGAIAEQSNETFVGTVTFRADDTYSLAAEANFTQIDTLSLDCIGDPETQTCEEARDTCTEAQGGDCECTEMRSNRFDEDGTWALSANTVSLDADARVTDFAYCVDGNMLQLLGNEDSTRFLYTAEKQ